MINDIKTLQGRLKELDGYIDWNEVASISGNTYHTVRKFVNGKGTDLAKLIGIVQIANYVYKQKVA